MKHANISAATVVDLRKQTWKELFQWEQKHELD